MSVESAGHETIRISRTFNHDVKKVLEAWGTTEAKSQWFIGPESWELIVRSLDFRVGGVEILEGKFEGKMKTQFTAHYHDIIPFQRIVYDYVMRLNGNIHSVSLSTVEFSGDEVQTEMSYTEQITFLDGTGSAEGGRMRIHGTEAHFERLTGFLG